MKNTVIETQYPITFRLEDTKTLGDHLKNRHSVVLIGMKRVGISNFLRFFLYHKDIVGTYISKTENHLFIPVDLNDLVEREFFPFWVLTFKRIIDSLEHAQVSKKTREMIDTLFLDGIQSKDLFLLMDGVRKSLLILVEEGISPTIFFLRFDRLKDAITPEFFDNLQGLKDATHQKLSYVFTGFRSLHSLAPHVFKKTSLAMFANDMYIQPAKKADTKIIYETYRNRYGITLSKEDETVLFSLVDGYVQYVQLALIYLHEQKAAKGKTIDFFNQLLKDERISFQSEELWESLTSAEQTVLLKVQAAEAITSQEREQAIYVWDTGIVTKEGHVFSPLFAAYIEQTYAKQKKEGSNVEFSKKEYTLFTFLKQHSNEICEREAIISAVWPEVEALGVSDWAIDRLIARVRSKLKAQNARFEIQTIKTRGYKLLSS